LDDVNADGRTALSEVGERGVAPGCIVRARGAHFDVKDRLRARGYRWEPEIGCKVWWREIANRDLVQELFSLAVHIYSVNLDPSALGPKLERVDARGRFVRAIRPPATRGFGRRSLSPSLILETTK
jgi:DNA polymerase-3 subunit epsilon